MSPRESDTENSWITKLEHFALQIPRDIAEFVFPRICIVSGEMLPPENSNDFVHDSVLTSLEKVIQADRDELHQKISADTSFTLLAFRGNCPLSEIIHAMKYKGFSKIGTLLGKDAGRDLTTVADFLIPVPLHKARLRERGYNQSGLIARGISYIKGGEVIEDAVLRIRNTPSQTKLGIDERASNVKDAFRINHKHASKFEGQSVLIVDDVVTTGSTANEVIKVIRNAGAANVGFASVAMSVINKSSMF